MMKTLLTGFLLLASSGLLNAETRVLHGYLMDQKCASYYRESQPEKLRDHSRGCVLACAKEAGLGLIAGSEYVPFDSDGQKRALQWLESSGKEKDLQVTVTFEAEAGKLKLVEIE